MVLSPSPSSPAADPGGGRRAGRVTGRGCGGEVAYRFHGVVHGHEGLQALPLEHVGELHVDGLHGPRVAHDPVLVRVGCVVVAGRAGGQTHAGVRRGWRGCWAAPTLPGHERVLALSCLQPTHTWGSEHWGQGLCERWAGLSPQWGRRVGGLRRSSVK